MHQGIFSFASQNMNHASRIDDMDLDEDSDEVVAVIPVFLCNSHHHSSTLGHGQSSVTILDQPLRPPTRPYDLHGVKSVRIKAQARRLEIDVPMDTRSRNYAETIEDFKKMPDLTLRSQCVEPLTSLALGCMENGKLLLLPIDLTLQMRPSLSHLDVGLASKKTQVAKAGQDEVVGGSSDDDDSDGEPVMRHVEVMVQKRETERQVAARLNSYAYMSSKEEEEAWLTLPLDTPQSQKSVMCFKAYLNPKSPLNQENQESLAPVTKQCYLKQIIPPPNAAPIDYTPTVVAPQKGGKGDLGDEELSLFSSAMRALLSRSTCTVITMQSVRQHLMDHVSSGAASGKLKEASQWPDGQLHELIVSLDFISSVHRKYLSKSTGNQMTDGVRGIIVEVLRNQDTFKKAEILKVIQDRGMNISEANCTKAIKEICVAHGYSWALKG